MGARGCTGCTASGSLLDEKRKEAHGVSGLHIIKALYALACKPRTTVPPLSPTDHTDTGVNASHTGAPKKKGQRLTAVLESGFNEWRRRRDYYPSHMRLIYIDFFIIKNKIPSKIPRILSLLHRLHFVVCCTMLLAYVSTGDTQTSQGKRLKTISIFNNKGGVGKTTLTFHLAHALAEMGYKTLLIDLDPQCNLTIYGMDQEQLHQIWKEEDPFIEDFKSCLLYTSPSPRD